MRKTSFIALTMSLVVLAGGVAQGASSGDIGTRVDRAKQEHRAAKDELHRAQERLDGLMEDYERTWHEWQSATADVLDFYQTRRELEAQLAQSKIEFNQRVSTAYQVGPGLSLELLLGSGSVSDFTAAQEYVASAFAVDEEQIDALAAQRAALAGTTEDLERRQRDARRAQEHLDQLAIEITARVEVAKAAAREAGLKVDRLEQQQKKLLDQQSSVARFLADLDTRGVGAGCSSGPVHDLIVEAFGPQGQDQVDYALMIATRESGCNPNAYNDIYVAPYGNAAGVFQILYPGIWEAWTKRCGYEGANPYDARANVEVAACVVADQGWGPWSL